MTCPDCFFGSRAFCFSWQVLLPRLEVFTVPFSQQQQRVWLPEFWNARHLMQSNFMG